MATIQEQLKEHLENANSWEKMEAPIPGVYIVKVPATKTRPAILHLEINPLKEDGKPMKRKGLFVGNKEMLVKFGELINDDKTFQLISEIEQINPELRYNHKKLKM